MESTAAWVYAGLAGLVVAFHAAVILGAPLGHLTMGGRWPGRLPPGGRLLSLASAGVIALAALVVLDRAGLAALGLPGWAMGAVLGLSAVAALANAATPSAAERRLWLPVALAMLAAAVLVVLA